MKMLMNCSSQEMKTKSNAAKTEVFTGYKRKKNSMDKKTIHILYSKRTFKRQFIIAL